MGLFVPFCDVCSEQFPKPCPEVAVSSLQCSSSTLGSNRHATRLCSQSCLSWEALYGCLSAVLKEQDCLLQLDTLVCCRWCEGKHKREGYGLLLFWVTKKLNTRRRGNVLGKHKSVTAWHRFILQTLNNRRGLQVNSLDGKGSSSASSRLINHCCGRLSLTGRVSVALMFVVLNSSLAYIALNSDTQEMKLISHSVCPLVVPQSGVWRASMWLYPDLPGKNLTLSFHKHTHTQFLTGFCGEEHVQSQMRAGKKMSSWGRNTANVPISPGPLNK